MRNTLSPTIMVLWLISLLAGCTTTPFGTHTAKFETFDPWVAKLNPGPGRVEFTTRLRRFDRVRLMLAQPDNWPQIAYLELLDENCEFGHKGHLVYLTERDGFQSLYFDQEAPWGSPIQASLEWNAEQGTLKATINGQYREVELLETPSTLSVSGRTSTDTLPNLVYQPAEPAAEQGESP